MLHAEVSAVLLGSLHSAFEHLRGVDQLQGVDWWQDVSVHEVGVQRPLLSVIVLDLGVNAVLGLIIDPLTNEQLVLVVVEVRALALTLVIDPVAFEVISVTLGQHAVAVALSLVPLAFVNVFVRVDHTALTLGHAADPVPVVTVTILVEEGTTAVLLILKPITSVLASKLLAFHAPVGALSVAFVKGPHAFVFVSILVVLNSETFLAVVAPVTDVLAAADPLVALDGAVFTSLLLLDPEDSAMGTILLGFGVVTKKSLQKTGTGRVEEVRTFSSSPRKAASVGSEGRSSTAGATAGCRQVARISCSKTGKPSETSIKLMRGTFNQRRNFVPRSQAPSTVHHTLTLESI